MERSLKVLGLLMLSCMAISSCVLLESEEQRQARAGLKVAVEELPQISGFETVKTINEEFRSEEGEGRCYYARAHIIMGTSLPEIEALDAYVKALQSLGWVPSHKQYERARALKRGVHELIVVYSGEPGIETRDAVDYGHLRSIYRAVVFVTLNFEVPARDGC